MQGLPRDAHDGWYFERGQLGLAEGTNALLDRRGLLGLVEGLATVILFDPGLFGLAAMVGFLVLTVWLVWTGVLCILRPGAAD